MGMVAHAYNHKTGEAKAGGLLWDQGQFGLYIKFQVRNKKSETGRFYEFLVV